jgi:hypothetical protein
MRKYSYFIWLIVVLSCNTTKIDSAVQQALLIGKWRLINKNQINYPTLEFTNGGAVFNSFADTIYGFSYKLKRNDLILDDGINLKMHNKIYKLTADSLIFQNLLEHKTVQKYVRQTL